MLFKRLSISLVIFISIVFSTIDVQAATLILGGDSIGINLGYDGVLITGTYDIKVGQKTYNPQSEGYSDGDLITHVNGIKIASIQELMNEIKNNISVSKDITLTLNHKGTTKTLPLSLQNKDDQFSTGLYVIDGISGIGTMTYYNPSTHHFGALGHMMSDTNLNISLSDVKGVIYKSKVTDIIKSQNGNPGEKIANISQIKVGDVIDNNEFGLYGSYDDAIIDNKTVIETADSSEVKKGKAFFYTVLNGNTVRKCEINITSLKKQTHQDIKGITFEVVNEEVLKLCNGIVQGMSGSPIVQDGKLIGCVTHVDIKDPHKGYGLYIDWMLENDN